MNITEIGKACPKAKQQSGVRQLISIDAITIHPLNVRMIRTNENISRLAESFKQRGMEYPIKVVQNPHTPSKYLCYDGGYRLEAAKLAGEKEIWVEIEDIKDETDLIIRSFDMGDKVVPLNPLEEARAFKFLMDKFKDIEKVGGAVGRHWKYVKEKLALLALVAKAKKLVLNGKMTWLPAYNLSKYPKHIQGKVLEIIEKSKFPGYDNIDITRALSKILGKSDDVSAQPLLKENTRTDLDWICPKCGIPYHTYCHGDKHSFERVWDKDEK